VKQERPHGSDPTQASVPIEHRRPPGHIRPFVGSVAFAACALGAMTIVFDHRSLQPAAVAGFALLTFLTAQFPLRMPTGSLYDISFVITFAAIVAAGPATATIANVFATLSIRELGNRPPIRHLFNAAQLTISAAIPGLAYRALGGPIGSAWRADDAAATLVPGALVALAIASLLHFALNTTLVSGAIAISERRRFLHAWRSFRSLARTYVAFALLGLLLGILQVRIGWASVLFLVIPLLVARQAFHAAVRMQAAYDDTVLTLIKAIEAKDPYTRGHAERVSRLAEMAARALHLPEVDCRLVRYAALMHDVGKLGVESKILQKQGKLTSEEYDHMKIHPGRGVDILGEIDLMAAALRGIRHHHERVDGTGYPDGIAGDEIPLIARLIMVADAFDSMTSTRSYRVAKTIDEAFTEIRRCTGTQFDPRAVAALERSVTQHGWQPQPEGRTITLERDDHAASI
jgi:HD-GYP domain-containing protein (c-di-GMP phosphodiesterase class II)